MDTIQNFTHTPKPQDFQKSSPSSISENGFPIMAMAVLGISAIAFLLVSYYIFATKCCFRWQQLDPLRRFSGDREHLNEDRSTAYSPSLQTRGLDDQLIQEIPTFKYIRSDQESNSLLKCVVCLNEFQEHDMLRILPKCNHGFHLDCIDLWLQSNSNCPLCRSAISGRNRCRLDRMMAPNSSPQNPQPSIESIVTEDFVMIEVSGETVTGRQHERNEASRILVQSRSHSSRKFELKNGKFKRKSHHVSVMGDEGIDVRGKDDRFSVQPIRRSFSMDSAVDHRIYLSVQEIVRHNWHHSEVSNNEENSNGSQKLIFSFGQGRGSRNAVLPIEF